MLQIRKYKEMELEMDHLISRWYYKKIVDTNSSSPPKYSLVANRRGGRGGGGRGEGWNKNVLGGKISKN